MKTPILIIGSGIAGLNLALKCSKFSKVILVTKAKLSDSNTDEAQGGLASVFEKDDSFQIHVEDTIRAGDGITNKKIARILAKSTPERVKELKRWGVNFDMNGKKFKLSREAVHSRPRIVHAKDITGHEISKTLIKKVKDNKKIEILEFHSAFELIIEKGRCMGSRVLDIKKNKIIDIFSLSIILATGGIGQLYSVNTNPDIASGDGIAMAFRSGALLEDMEFVQFHPTMLHNSNPSLLISETLRGEGGLLKNKYGKSYMKRYHRDGDLGPRDVVSMFSVKEMNKTGAKNVFLDITHFEEDFIKKRFPHIYKSCLNYNIDITKEMIPVSPAAHYICGGIKTDSYGKTSIKNLYAVGECACTQLHGADRLASNSMTEGLVFGTRLSSKLKKIKKKKIKEKHLERVEIQKPRNGKIERIKKQIQKIMWDNVGIFRNKKGLNIALEKLEKIESKIKSIKEKGINAEILEVENLCILGKIVAVSALRRKESRGTHAFTDYPERYDNIWLKHLTIDKNHRKLK